MAVAKRARPAPAQPLLLAVALTVSVAVAAASRFEPRPLPWCASHLELVSPAEQVRRAALCNSPASGK